MYILRTTGAQNSNDSQHDSQQAAKTVTATAVLPWSLSPFPRYYHVKATHYHGNYRSYRGISAVFVTVSLSVYKYAVLSCGLLVFLSGTP